MQGRWLASTICEGLWLDHGSLFQLNMEIHDIRDVDKLETQLAIGLATIINK